MTGLGKASNKNTTHRSSQEVRHWGKVVTQMLSRPRWERGRVWAGQREHRGSTPESRRMTTRPSHGSTPNSLSINLIPWQSLLHK